MWEVRDAPHVTLFNESYTLIDTGEASLQLWDTPGFGDSARLLKRLRGQRHPLLWFLMQTWDRFTDRPLWCSQQALKNVKDEADVVLYLVSAAERPEGASYVDYEMQILAWVGKPVLVLLNQTGPPGDPSTEEAEMESWRAHLARYEVVRGVLSLDAFARCWVQEERLMEALGEILPADRRKDLSKIQRAWHQRNMEVFDKSLQILAEQLSASALQGVEVRAETLWERVGIGRGEINKEYNAARQQLATLLADQVEATTNKLIALHGLEGAAGKRMQQAAREHFHEPTQVSETIWSVLGSFAGGAMGGLIADLKLGGMTFGGGALIGGLATGLGAYALIRSYNLVRGGDQRLHWSREHFREQVRLALLCYLAVAHFGRGRGEWKDSEQPAHWRDVVGAVVEDRQEAIDHLWEQAVEKGAMPDGIFRGMRRLVNDCARSVFARLYSGARFGGD